MRSDGRARCGPHSHQKEKIHHGPASLCRPRSYGRKATPRAGSAAARGALPAISAPLMAPIEMAGDPIRLQLGLGQRGIYAGLVGAECTAALQKQRDAFERGPASSSSGHLGANHSPADRSRRAWARAAVTSQRYPARLDEPDANAALARWLGVA
jgi:hypothetical protein